jgi:hypothetical protein
MRIAHNLHSASSWLCASIYQATPPATSFSLVPQLLAAMPLPVRPVLWLRWLLLHRIWMDTHFSSTPPCFGATGSVRRHWRRLLARVALPAMEEQLRSPCHMQQATTI